MTICFFTRGVTFYEEYKNSDLYITMDMYITFNNLIKCINV